LAVLVSNTQRKLKVQVGSLRKAASSALEYMGYPNAELSILVTGDRKMRALNRKYRGVDKTTDVLSFSALEGEAALNASSGGEGGPPVALGDIVISAPRALSQAEEIGQSLEDELSFLLVHGILHLVGYDHERSSSDKRRMEKKQKEIVGFLRRN
jgi:probable rRNA maturation factor